MTKNLPSKRYDLFITAFEKEVARHQEDIKKIEKQERLYNIAKRVMESHNLINDNIIRIHTSHVSIHVEAVKSDSIKKFHVIADDIAKALVEADLKFEPTWALDKEGGWHSLNYGIYTILSSYIIITVNMPVTGISDVKVHKESYTYSSERYRLEVLDKADHTEITRDSIPF